MNHINNPIHINHADLKRFDDRSIFRSICPECPDGILGVRREMTTFKLKEADHCIGCGQQFIYDDIDELRSIETNGKDLTELTQEEIDNIKPGDRINLNGTPIHVANHDILEQLQHVKENIIIVCILAATSPPPGQMTNPTKGICGSCKQDIWVSPELTEKMPLNSYLRCTKCAIRDMPDDR